MSSNFSHFDSMESILAAMRSIASREKELAEAISKQTNDLKQIVNEPPAGSEKLTQAGHKVEKVFRSAKENHAAGRLQMEGLIEALYETFEDQE